MASPAANGVASPQPPAAQPTPPATQASAPDLSSSTPLPAEPATSLQDDGTSRRPRDIRNIHLLLASNGVQAYQERVPLMLLDYVYRYTSGVLSDAQALTADAGGIGSGRNAQEGGVTLNALRQAIAARNHFHIQPQLQKEELMELAREVNSVALPKPRREFGLRLPPEKYCLTGSGFSLKEEWSEEEEVLEDQEEEPAGEAMTGIEGEGNAAEDEEIDADEFQDVMMGDQEETQDV